jgi:hypothetical protein
MAKSLNEILGARNFTGVIESVRASLPRLLPPAFYNVGRGVVGNKGTYFKTVGARTSAGYNQYGAPASIVNGEQMSEVGVTLLHSFKQYNHDPLVLQNLLNPANEAVQEMATTEIDRQTRNFITQFENNRTSAIYSALAKGAIYIASDGQQLTSSASAAYTVDYGVTPSTASATWATTSTDILASVQAVKKAQLQAGKPPLRFAFYGANVADYIFRNARASSFINGNSVLAERAYNTGEIPDGFCDLTWVPVYSAFVRSKSGVNTDWFGADQITFTPEPNIDWWETIEGTFLAPADLGAVSADPVAAASNLASRKGMFSYAKVGHNPPTIEHYAGDTFLPIVKDGGSIVIFDTTT